MTVLEFLRNEISNDRMNTHTIFTVNFKKKNYLCTIQECNEIFGKLLLKDCKKRSESDNQEVENSFILKVV